MIKSLPGWANLLLLWVAYMVFGFGLFFLFQALAGSALKGAPRLFIVFYIILQTSLHAGMYLAKWRFWDGGFHFQ